MPRVFPLSSLPLYCFFCFSIRSLIEAQSFAAKDFIKRLPSIIPLDPSNIPHKTNSLTAFELAPGVLKTTIPFLEASSVGILLVPAPALAIHLRLLPISLELSL